MKNKILKNSAAFLIFVLGLLLIYGYVSIQWLETGVPDRAVGIGVTILSLLTWKSSFKN